jgi:hypothetical protein
MVISHTARHESGNGILVEVEIFLGSRLYRYRREAPT